ncbi:MAG: hypothetical protein OEV44_09210, partial [Spirochaetota bacterium]|nr:hypothetical protein [Spirochaetota bacterium]
MNKIEINLQSQNNYPFIGNKKIGVTLLRKMIKSVLTSLSVKNKTVSFMFCNNQIIKVLNSEYRK